MTVCAFLNCRCRLLLSSIPGWKSCSCCGSDLQQDALAANRAGAAGTEGDADLDLALATHFERLCADPDCDGFLCQVKSSFAGGKSSFFAGGFCARVPPEAYPDLRAGRHASDLAREQVVSLAFSVQASSSARFKA